MRKQILSLLAGVVLLASATTATALSSWDLNVSNVDLGVYGTYATVGIDVSGHTASFNIDADQGLLGTGDNFGFDKFFFNTQLSTIDASDFNFGGSTAWEVRYDKNVAGFGLFEIQYKGTGGTRFDPLVFTITDASITNDLDFYEANAEGYHFVAHIGGFPTLNGNTSVQVADGPPVPEPGTIVLLGAGLLGLAIFGKRRMNKEA